MSMIVLLTCGFIVVPCLILLVVFAGERGSYVPPPGPLPPPGPIGEVDE